jgi:D-inositol-3-phosphate glycosyltransferase
MAGANIAGYEEVRVVGPVVPRRVAMLSVHTSPLEQPGTGDAGGLNVYVVETARRLAGQGIQVEIFTRATSSSAPAAVSLAPGVLVRQVLTGPFEGLPKHDLPGLVCQFAAAALQVEARHEPGWYDLVHSHYWLSGQAGRMVADRWRVPLVHTMHTMAKVKNALLATGDTAEPLTRVIGEEQVVAGSDRLLANTEDEARQLVDMYGADPARVAVVPPGVDLATFVPGGVGARRAARRKLGLPPEAQLLLFVGRIQPLKAPDVLLRAVARLIAERPTRRGRLRVAVLGGPSGSGLDRPERLQQLAAELGIADLASFHHPVSRPVLADWYRAADLVAVPSFSESFGLVAIEAQACGTPVVAARVGGLQTAVAHEVSGLLVDGHDPVDWAGALGALLDDEPRRQRMRSEAVARARQLSWDATTDAILDVYAGALADRRCGRRVVLTPVGGSRNVLAVAP